MKKDLSLFGAIVCSRTSAFGDKPCDEAFMEPYVRVDRRTTDDPMKKPHIGADWYKCGRNHRVENRMIARDFDDERWVVHIDNASELQAFIAKYGRVVLSINDQGTQRCFEVEIYDAYRE